MPLARKDRKARRQQRRRRARGVHDRAGLEAPRRVSTRRAAIETASMPSRCTAPRAHGALQQPPRGVDRVDDAVARDAQRPGEPGPQIRLRPRELLPGEVLDRDAPLRSRSAALAADVSQLLLVRGDPERPGRLVLACGRHLPASSIQSRRESVVSANCASESSMTTTCPIAAAVAPPPANRDSSTVDRKPGRRQRVGAGRPDDPGADDENVRRRHRHRQTQAVRGRVAGIEEERRPSGDVGAALDPRDESARRAARASR